MSHHQTTDHQTTDTLLQAILESSPEVIVFALDRDYRYLAFNKLHAATMGAIWGEVVTVGQCMLDVISDPLDREKARCSFDRALAGESFVTEDEYGDVELERRYWQNFMAPIRGVDDTVIGLTVFVIDISDRRRAELALMNREVFLSTLLDAMPVPVFVTDPEGRFQRLNAAHESFFGLSSAACLGRTMADLLPHDLVSKSHARDLDGADLGHVQPFENRMPTATGEMRDVVLHEAVLHDAHGRPNGVVGVLTDITERKQVEQALAQREQEFRTLVEHSSDWVARYGPDLRTSYVNPAFAEAVRCHEGNPLGRTPTECPGGRNADEFEMLMADVFRVGRAREFELFWAPQPDAELCALISITPEFDDAGEVVSVLAVGRDVTELNASRRKIHQMAFYDALTGLPNRSLFNDRLEHAITDSAWRRQMFGLMMIDLDRFKAINDTLGHRAGDELLCEVGRRLASVVRPYDTVARLGGDEFTILLPNVRETDDLGRIADKLLDQFSRSFVLEGTEVFVSCSIGIAVYPDDGRSADDLLRFADSAMYHAKHCGRNTFKFFSTDLTKGAEDRLALEIDLRRALERNELHVQFQPQVSMTTGQIVGSEALLRWTHPEHGRVPPDRFIPIAEDTGLISKIGAWVLREACAAAVRWNAPGRRTHQVAVNISPRQLQSPHLVDEVAAIFAETGCRPEWIELEITERLLLDKDGGGLAVLLALREMGVTIAIDDFGTGYSALSYLTRFPLDTLKMDHTFIHEATTEPGRAGLVGAVLSIAKCLGLKVVAEGVETAEQAAMLIEQGCDVAQGYWYSRPVDPHAFDELPAILPAGPAAYVDA